MNQNPISASARSLAVAALAAATLYGGSAVAQNITTVAGNGTPGYAGDGGQATAASFAETISVTVDAAGNRYVLDRGNVRIRKVTPAGVVSTVVGTGAPGDSGDGGPATAATFRDVYDIAVDGAGNLYFGDWQSHRIRRVDTNGIITTIAGNGVAGYSGDGGPAVDAQISYPVGVTVDRFGAVYFTDYMHCRVRKIAANGVISTLAGTTCGYGGDNGPATAAQLNTPVGIDVDANGNVYVAEYMSGQRVRRISAGGVITTAAGNGMPASTGDGGPATAASLNTPWDVEVDASGNLYISEFSGNRVRRVSTAGVISTIAGTGAAGYNGDNRPATSASLSMPAGLSVGGGALHIAEYAGYRVRRIALFSTCAAEGFSGGKLTMCQKICEIPQSPSMLSSLIRLYVAAYREEPPCAR